MHWTRRAAVTGMAGIGLVLGGAGVASAQGDPTPAPITISSQQVEQLCTQRVPKLQNEVTTLLGRIDASATTPGSTLWLRAQALQARSNGHPARADVLSGRADRRDGVRTVLLGVKAKLTNFTSQHCDGDQ